MTKNIEEKIRRPEILDAEVIRFENNDEKWIAFVGLKDKKPYEIFTGKSDSEFLPLPKTIDKGQILKVKENGSSRYDFQYKDKYGYTNTMGGLSYQFDREIWNYSKMVSGMLSGGMKIDYVRKIVSKLDEENPIVKAWKSGVEKSLIKYSKNKK